MSNREPHVPPQDWMGGPSKWTAAGIEYLRACGHTPESWERVQAEEEAPLRLTDSQRRRLLLVLESEVGHISSGKILERIEREV